MNTKTGYQLTFLNIDGHPLWGVQDVVDEPYDYYRPLLGQADSVDCVLDSPFQDDKRATYRLRIERRWSE